MPEVVLGLVLLTPLVSNTMEPTENDYQEADSPRVQSKRATPTVLFLTSDSVNPFQDEKLAGCDAEPSAPSIRPLVTTHTH